MASLLIARQVAANPIGTPVFTAPAPSAVLEVATTTVVTVACDAACTRADLLLASGEVLSSVVPVAGVATFYWSPGQLRAGSQTLVARTYRGNSSYAQASLGVTVSGTPLASLWDIGYWHADDLASQYNDGATISAWAPRSGAGTWAPSAISPTTPAPTYQSYDGGNGWPGNQRKGCVLFALGQGLDMACPAAFTGGNRRTVLLVYQQMTGSGTQTLLAASATAGATNKWQLYSIAAPAAYKVRRGGTDATFGVAADQRNDTGPGHFVCVQDPGTGNIGLSRDVLWQSVAQSAANAAVTTNTPTRLSLGFNYNGTTVPTNFGNFKLLAIFMGTQVVTDAQIQKCAYQALGLYDMDQFYGDSTTPFKLNPVAGQSNAQGLAASALPSIAAIRFMAISTNNWVADMVTPVSIGPQSGNLGPWYQFAQDRRVATGIDVHMCLLGQGATGVNSFKEPLYNGLYSAQLFDSLCRVVAEAKAALGGAPDIDRFLIVEGETDSQSGAGSSTYQANFTTWCSNIRALIPGCSASTRIVAPQVSSFSGYAFGATVQAAQVAWAAADVNGAAPSVASLASAAFFNPDNIHYNQAGTLGLGSIGAAA